MSRLEQEFRIVSLENSMDLDPDYDGYSFDPSEHKGWKEGTREYRDWKKSRKDVVTGRDAKREIVGDIGRIIGERARQLENQPTSHSPRREVKGIDAENKRREEKNERVREIVSTPRREIKRRLLRGGR